MIRKYWIVGSIPFILMFVITWIPAINGPQLWFGVPSLFLWLTAISTFGIPAVLIYFEKSRKDLTEETDE